MIEDMTIRKFAPKTQHDYVQTGPDARDQDRHLMTRPRACKSACSPRWSFAGRRSESGVPQKAEVVGTLEHFRIGPQPKMLQGF
jgi:hypothetical protein